MLHFTLRAVKVVIILICFSKGFKRVSLLPKKPLSSSVMRLTLEVRRSAVPKVK